MVLNKPRNPGLHLIPRVAMFATFAILLCSSARAIAKTTPLLLCVNHAGSGGCLTTIQGAVNTVPAGGSAVIMIAGDINIYSETITVTNASISFVGAGPGMTIVDGTNGADLPTFIFQNNSSGELHQMTIQNGRGGGGSNIRFNQFATKGSKGVGTLIIENCEVQGGVHPSNRLPEGTINFVGKTLIVDSTSIVNNVDQGILINGAPKVFITNTTISGNTTAGNHGNATGCGLHISSGTIVLNNDTITDNHCIGGSGMGQSPTVGGGIFVDFPPKVSISNTIIADNTVAGTLPGGPDCFSPGKGVKSKGHNLIKNTSQCNIKLVSTDLATGTDPDLAALSACSGLLVSPPLGGSPVLDMGNPGTPNGKVGAASTACLPLDECGGARAKAMCAIGATQ